MLVATLLVSPAAACGGFACNRAVPIVQAGEEIVVGIGPDQVEMHVRVAFDGPSEDFSWIVPVPAVPELLLSSSAIFDQLPFATALYLPLRNVDEGHCRDPIDLSFGVEYDVAFAAGVQVGALEGGTTVGGVHVVSEQAIGPYETVTLSASDATTLTEWLQGEGYDLPDGIDAVLAPYVSDGGMFVALKLAKDADTGDLAPLALRYPGTTATIPIQLTSVSAELDLPIAVYVFSDGRGVPLSYLHARPNLAAVDWWRGGTNWPDLVARAADEAGSHAFLTEYHGSSDVVPRLWIESAFDEGALRAADSAADWLAGVAAAAPIPSAELFGLLEALDGLAPGQGAALVSCPTCIDTRAFEAGAWTDALVADVVPGLRAVQALVDGAPRLTRLSTTLDPSEMTVDPTFVVNRDLDGDEVASTHPAKLVTHCANGRRRDHAPRTLDLEDGRSIELRSDDWLADHRTDPFSSLGPMTGIAAQVIEQMGPEGEPTVLVDRTADLLALLDEHNRGIGCATVRPSGLALVGLALIRRRRR